jgi:hypothetical protein
VSAAMKTFIVTAIALSPSRHWPAASKISKLWPGFRHA